MPSARRPARRSVGREVAARTQALSDELLGLEQAAFVDIFDLFGSWAPAASEALRSRQLIVAYLEECLAGATAITDNLVQVCADRSLEAICAELWMMEEALPKSQHGRWTRARGAVNLEGIVTRAMDAFEVSLPNIRRGFVDLYAQQARLATGMPDLEVRVFSQYRLRLRGNSGMGIWYRPVSWLEGHARAASIWSSNWARSQAIAGANG